MKSKKKQEQNKLQKIPDEKEIIMNLIMEKTVKPKPETAEKRVAAYDRLLNQRENEEKEEADYDYLITI